LARSGWNYRKLVAASTVSNLGDGVSQIAYPWMASVVTRNPVLIALIAVVQRLPWLVFSLPAGVLTDRVARRRLMIAANSARAVLTMVVALAVAWLGSDLPRPDELDDVAGTRVGLYLMLVVASLLLGIGEVVHDNAAQTFMPSIVEPADLERANGRLYAAELVANQFLGPPLGALLLTAGFALPFFVDAGTFAVAVALVALIVPTVRPDAPTPVDIGAARASWRRDLREGVTWLWNHRFLRSLAITLAGANLLSALTTSSFVLYAQEVLGTNTREYALITIISAVGGLVSGWLAGRITQRLGAGLLLRAGLVTFTGVSLAMGSVSTWWVAALILSVEYFVGMLWNVVTISLRQTIIPDRLLGRVNSVYRFFAWGMLPVGAILGGLVVAITDQFTSREIALRMPWWVAGAGYVALIGLYGLPRLSTERVEAARAAARTTV
jgi:MFS family permease